MDNTQKKKKKNRKGFSADLDKFCYSECKYQISFAKSGQLFEIQP